MDLKIQYNNTVTNSTIPKKDISLFEPQSEKGADKKI